jgi:hypothetical protein
MISRRASLATPQTSITRATVMAVITGPSQARRPARLRAGRASGGWASRATAWGSSFDQRARRESENRPG